MSQTILDFEADIARDVERLTTLAGELALERGKHGITVSDLRLAAETRGILTGKESEGRMKALNLGKIPRKAGLYPTGEFRKSRIKRAHKNRNQVYVIREYAEVAA